MKGFENINISEHCKQRYVERIKDITDRQELRRYIVLHEQDIIQNIRKMLQFGEIIYTGKNFEAKDNKIIHIILNGAWLVFVGKDSQTAITMYKIDLGLDEDFNKDYIQKFLEKLKGIDQEYQEQEEHLLSMVYEKFLDSDLTEEEQKELKEIDHAMLWYDLEHLLGEIQYGETAELHIDLDYTVRPFEEVEEEYLSLFEKFSSL